QNFATSGRLTPRGRNRAKFPFRRGFDNPMLGIETAPLEAVGRPCMIARRDTGQSCRVASFLLAWHNAEENGGWDPTGLWNVDTAVGEDLLTVLKLASESRCYPGDLGFKPEIKAVWQLWHGGPKA